MAASEVTSSWLEIVKEPEEGFVFRRARAMKRAPIFKFASVKTERAMDASKASRAWERISELLMNLLHYLVEVVRMAQGPLMFPLAGFLVAWIAIILSHLVLAHVWAISSPFFMSLAAVGELVHGATGHVSTAVCSAPVLGMMCPANGNLTVSWTVCELPVFKAFCTSTSLSAPAPRADYPRLIDIQTRNLVPLLDETIHGPGLSLEIKKAEMVAIDISSNIRNSALPSRTAFADHLLAFRQEAREAQHGLQRFSSHLTSALERVLNINDYALHAIRRARSRDCQTWPFSWFGWCEHNVEEVVSRTFALALDVVARNMERLVHEAESNFDNIGRLEEHLNAIAQLHASESISVTSMMATLQDDFWTRLGLNGAAVRRVHGLQALLTVVGQSRQHAHAHVVAVLQTLHGMSADMEELREHLHAPDSIGDTIPVDIQIESLMKGIERLKARRIMVVETVLTLSGEN